MAEKKHHKRRFVNPENLHHIHRLLKPDGMFYFASDIPDYVSWALVHIRDHGGFKWQAGVRRLADPFCRLGSDTL